MRLKTYKYMAGDFETTVYDGQEYTEVWASGLCELGSEDVQIFHSIDDTWDFLRSLNQNIVVYYHNLKFDGTFWIDFLINKLNMQQAFRKRGNSDYELEWLEDKEMISNTFKYSISDRGQWYFIKIKAGRNFIELRDSLKLLPFSLKVIGESFKTKHRKLDIEYKGFRYAGCEITAEELAYLKNDVLVLKEGLEVMFSEGHNKLTIGACCLSEYKSIISKKAYGVYFPDLTAWALDPDLFDVNNVDKYIRRSYRGGWCYLKEGHANKIFDKGFTADVNSLYPSMMSSESGNVYPIGDPTFWRGNFIPDEAIGKDKYYFVRVKTRFYLKDGKLPFIQVKGNWLYKGTEMLKTSDIKHTKTGKYSRFYRGLDGKRHDSFLILTLTMTDFRLFLEHYNVRDFEILDGCYFSALAGIFDRYMERYKKIKMESKGARREIAKLFLNNLYGKMASSDDSSFKVAYKQDDDSIAFYPVEDHTKKVGFIPVGSAITSYARAFTIRAAQENYERFIYADTDSIHCYGSANDVQGLKIHPTDFCSWKLESYWDAAIFVRQKTYIEHVTHEDGEPIEEPFYNVKCAGMPQRCKDLFIKSITNYRLTDEDLEHYDADELDFLSTPRTLSDFKVGLKIKGKLLPKRIKGGTVLIDGFYEMRNI